jgi:hypothetical protein
LSRTSGFERGGLPVERAKIEVSKAEIVSRLQGEESRVDQGLAEQKLAVQKAKLAFNQRRATQR